MLKNNNLGSATSKWYNSQAMIVMYDDTNEDFVSSQI